jgi:hypothetical protein
VLSFKDFIVVDYTQTGDEQLAYNAHKRRRGRIGEETETTDEALSIAQRRQKAMTMKRFKSKIAMGRKRALAKAPTPEKVMKRAQKQARDTLFKKFAKGQSRSDLTPQARANIEKRVAKAKGAVQRITKKLLPQIRKLDKERRSKK